MSGLVRAYGEYWNPDAVEWGTTGPGNKGQLLGKRKYGKKTQEVDMWDQRGVYLLTHDFRVVYAGQTQSQALGKRLRDHLTDRFAGRWDMFSWYGIAAITKKGNVRQPGTRQLKAATVVDTLEAFAIASITPPLNRKYEKLPTAERIEQKKAGNPQTIRHYLEAILKYLEEGK